MTTKAVIQKGNSQLTILERKKERKNGMEGKRESQLDASNLKERGKLTKY